MKLQTRIHNHQQPLNRSLRKEAKTLSPQEEQEQQIDRVLMIAMPLVLAGSGAATAAAPTATMVAAGAGAVGNIGYLARQMRNEPGMTEQDYLAMGFAMAGLYGGVAMLGKAAAWAGQHVAPLVGLPTPAASAIVGGASGIGLYLLTKKLNEKG